MKNQEAERIDAVVDLNALDRIAAKVYKIAAEHGFHEGEVIGKEAATKERIAIFIANLHSECSELWESSKRGSLFDECDKNIGVTSAGEELADIIIRALDTAHTLGISISSAVSLKSAYNETRPYKHGKNC